MKRDVEVIEPLDGTASDDVFEVNAEYYYAKAKSRNIPAEEIEEILAEHSEDRDALFMALKNTGLSLTEIGRGVKPAVSRQRVQQVVGVTPRAEKRRMDVEEFNRIKEIIWKRAAQEPDFWAGRGRLNRDKVMADLVELTGCTKSEASLLAKDINIPKAALFLLVGFDIPLEDHAAWIQSQIDGDNSQTTIWKHVDSALPNIGLSQMAWCRYQNNTLKAAQNGNTPA